MSGWRTLATLGIALAAVQNGWAQPYALSEKSQAGDCFRIQLEMKLSGTIQVIRDGKEVSLQLEAAASHEFPERVLNVGPDGLPDKSARVYEKAKALISVDKDRSERVLRPERRLFVAQRHKDQFLAYSLGGPLTREELELTNEHFDTLALSGLLPGQPVAVGDTWKVANPVVQALCGFEGLTEQDLVCKLEEIKNQSARVSVTGSAAGIDLGALVKLGIQASYSYDLDSKHLTRLEWKQKDERKPGPASPATSVQTTVTLSRSAIEQPASLTDIALVSVPEGFEPPLPLTQLELRDAKDRFEMGYGREWQTVSQTNEHLVLRLIERGDFVAQATVTPWTKAEKGKHLSPEEFQQAMEDTPGWDPEQELQSGEVPADGGKWIYRISALGQLDGMKVMQNFYLVAGPGGEQVVLAFTLAPKQAERLGTRDISMAANLDLPSSRKEPAKP
jgi:hypothetical protein